MKTKILRFALAILATTTAAQSLAQEGDRMPVRDLKPLLKAAIEHGMARGVIVGDAAAYVRQHFDTSAPIEVDVKSLHALPQAGCKRLEVTTRQLAVSENGKREDKELGYQLSYCRDGTFPEKR